MLTPSQLALFAVGWIAPSLRRGSVWQRVQCWLFGGVLAGFAVHLAFAGRR